MSHIVKLALAGVALFATASVPALAADLYVPPVIEYEPPVISHGGWYLRGHIGMSNQRVDSIYNVLFDTTDTLEFLDDPSFDSAPVFGVGVGYEFSRWLRVDATAEYRGKAKFSALDRYDETGDGVWDGTNDYSASKSEWLFLANAYVDVADFNGIVPYLGAGIGASRNTIHDFRDVNDPNLGVAYAEDHSEWDLAWALHAGVGFEATEKLTLDLGYSFVHLGDARTGDVRPFNGPGTIDNPMHFRDLTSHDFKLGVRYSLN